MFSDEAIVKRIAAFMREVERSVDRELLLAAVSRDWQISNLPNDSLARVSGEVSGIRHICEKLLDDRGPAELLCAGYYCSDVVLDPAKKEVQEIPV